jgi:uroporphyrinogen-III synthase
VEKVLDNINIVLTRTKNQSVETTRLLEELGANVISFPTIKISTITDDNDLDTEIKNVNYYNSLIFTSENAVRSFIQKIGELDINFDPKAFFVISIGDRTTQVCSEFGFRIDFQSNTSTSESMLKELGYIDLIGRKILVPCSNLAKPNQFESLENHGAIIHSLPIYFNSVNDKSNLTEEINQLNSNNPDLFIFTSPSTFRGFIKIMGIKEPVKYFKNKKIAVIGPVTQKELIKYGLKPDIFPKNFTMNFLIEEIKEFYRKEKSVYE